MVGPSLDEFLAYFLGHSDPDVIPYGGGLGTHFKFSFKSCINLAS
jgi:hypothetical protein